MFCVLPRDDNWVFVVDITEKILACRRLLLVTRNLDQAVMFCVLPRDDNWVDITDFMTGRYGIKTPD
jgi:hypothetical protein